MVNAPMKINFHLWHVVDSVSLKTKKKKVTFLNAVSTEKSDYLNYDCQSAENNQKFFFVTVS